MIRPRAIVLNKQQVCSDSFITGVNESVVIMPFDDDTEYQMRFKVKTNTNSEVKNTISTADDNIIEIEHSRPETLVLPTASRPKAEFAVDGTYKYFISYSVAACRSPAGQIFQVTYQILRKPV